MWYLLTIVLIIIILILYACCVLAGEADDRAERLYEEEISKRSWDKERVE